MQFTHSTFQTLKTRVNRRSERVYSELFYVGMVAQVASGMKRVGRYSEREEKERKRKRERRQREIRRREGFRGKDVEERGATHRKRGRERFTNSKLQAYNSAVLLGRKLGRDFLSHHEKNVLESKLYEKIRMR